MSTQSKAVPFPALVWVSGITTRTRRGKMQTGLLECGHMVNTTAQERNVGACACFDCYYGKPQDSVGKVVLEALAKGTMKGNLPASWAQVTVMDEAHHVGKLHRGAKRRRAGNGK